MKQSDNTLTQDSVKYSMEVKLNVDPEVSPSLVLDMINTDTQQTASQHSCTPTFHIDRECNGFAGCYWIRVTTVLAPRYR